MKSNKTTKIVEQQVKKWSNRNREAFSSNKKQLSKPVITISREYGAEGAAIGNKIAEKLGYDFWDKNLLQKVADESGNNEKFLQSIDEKRRLFVEDTIAGFLNLNSTNLHYIRALMKVIKTIEVQGNSIIVGRGANHICTLNKALHVRVVCPLEQRVESYAAKNDITKNKAREIILKRDNERAEFIQHYFQEDISDASNYDIVVNSGTMNHQDLVSIICNTYEQKIEMGQE